MNVRRYPISPRDNPDCLEYRLPPWLMHDLLQPFNALGLMMEELGAELARLCPQETELHKVLEQMRRAIGMEQSLMASLRQYLRSSYPSAEMEKHQPVQLLPLLDEVVGQYRMSFPKIVVEIGDLPNLFIESVRYLLKDLLCCLVENAFVHAKSSVVVSARSTVDGLLLQIQDDGAGLSEEVLDRLGMPFIKTRKIKRVRHHGLGLGIFLAGKYASRLGHALTYAKLRGGGACFALLLPYSAGFSPVNRKRERLILEGRQIVLCGLPDRLAVEIGRALAFLGGEGVERVNDPAELAARPGESDLVVTVSECWSHGQVEILKGSRGNPGFLVLCGKPGLSASEAQENDGGKRVQYVDLPLSLPRLLGALLQCLAPSGR